MAWRSALWSMEQGMEQGQTGLCRRASYQDRLKAALARGRPSAVEQALLKALARGARSAQYLCDEGAPSPDRYELRVVERLPVTESISRLGKPSQRCNGRLHYPALWLQACRPICSSRPRLRHAHLLSLARPAVLRTPRALLMEFLQAAPQGCSSARTRRRRTRQSCPATSR